MKLLVFLGFLFSVQSVSADTRILVLFDTSGSMLTGVPAKDCKWMLADCDLMKGRAQLQAFGQALRTLPDPQCTEMHLKVVYWSSMVHFQSSWHSIADSAARRATAQYIEQGRPSISDSTFPRYAMQFAIRTMAMAPTEEYAVILVGDGQNDDEWTSTEGHLLARKHRFRYYDVTYEPMMSMFELSQSFMETLSAIQETLHGCFG